MWYNVLLQLQEGVDVCPSAVPHEARVDVLLHALPETEAKWLRTVTMEIDYVRVVIGTLYFLERRGGKGGE